MKKIKYIVAGLALLCSAGAFAQDQGLTLKVNYAVAIPTGSYKDVINNNSYKGVGAELMYHFNNSFSLGIESGSQVFYRKFARQVYKATDGSDVSAVLSNAVQTVPVLLKGQYNFFAESAVRPYIALAAGGNAITFNQYAGQYTNDSKTKFDFAVRPEAGIYMPFKKYSRAGFSLGAGYNYMPFNYNGIGNLNSITVRAGISFPLD